MKKSSAAAGLLILLAVLIFNTEHLVNDVVTPTPETEVKIYLPIISSAYSSPHTSSKKCVALGSGLEEDQIRNLGARCTYFYSPAVPTIDGIQIFGMISKSVFTTTSTSPYFMGWNEPDLRDPNWSMSPTEAAVLWPDVVRANPGKLPVAPGISQGVYWRTPSGIDWLKQFYAEHQRIWGRPPEMAALTIHCYLDTADQCIVLVKRVIELAKLWGIPEVWVTEFAFWRSADWAEQTQKFVAWMEAEPMITKYFWWALTYKGDEPWAVGFFTQLYDFYTGELTPAGELYRKLP